MKNNQHRKKETQIKKDRKEDTQTDRRKDR